MKQAAFWKKFRRNRIGLIAFAVVLLYFFTAIGVELYSAYCSAGKQLPAYARGNEAEIFLPPSRHHLFGTDYQGRDVFLRAVAGCSTAVKVGLAGGGIAVVIGVALGAAAGFFGGRLDDWTVWLYSTFAAMPTLLFVLAFALLVSQDFLAPQLQTVVRWAARILHTEPGMLGVYFAIGLTGWVTLCRVVRGEVFKLRNLPYVAAARVAGVPSWRIIVRHILPNVFHLVIIYFTLLFAGAIMLEVIVSYLGLGAQSTPSWGVMIANGQERLWRGIWWEIAGATGMMFALVLALNLLGDALRDVLDPRR